MEYDIHAEESEAPLCLIGQEDLNDYDQVAEDILTKGYGTLILKQDPLVKEVLEGFNQFLSKSDKEKERWMVEKHAPDPNMGFIIRRGKAKPEGGFYDNKEFFHYIPERLVEALVDQNVPCKAEGKWLVQSGDLLEICLYHTLKVARTLEKRLSLPRGELVNKFQAARREHVLRSLNYHQNREGGFAQGHIDQSCFTMAIFENYPGLKLLPQGADGERIPHIWQPDKAIIFPGKKGELETNGALTALEHVVDKESDIMRQAIIAFLHTLLKLPKKIQKSY